MPEKRRGAGGASSGFLYLIYPVLLRDTSVIMRNWTKLMTSGCEQKANPERHAVTLLCCVAGKELWDILRILCWGEVFVWLNWQRALAGESSGLWELHPVPDFSLFRHTGACRLLSCFVRDRSAVRNPWPRQTVVTMLYIIANQISRDGRERPKTPLLQKLRPCYLN